LLFSHLVLFGYVYPAEAARIPQELMAAFMDRLQQEQNAPTGELLCQGPLLSRAQYLIDIQDWGYRDPRLAPRGKMSSEDVAIWTAAIGVDNPSLGR
jgi:hypothetical protein